MAFVSRNLSNVQSNLRNAIAECETGSSRKPVPMTYQNFASGIYQTYCRNWCDAPGDDVFVEMNDTFFAKCAIVVLKDHGIFSTFIPSWVLNVVNEEFFSLLHQNIGAFCLRMRENHSVRLQMADLLGGCEFCHGFYEKYGLNFCSISPNSC